MFGLMTRRQYMREITKAREAYRWERDEAVAKAHQTQREFEQKLDSLVRPRVVGGGFDKRIMVLDIDDLFRGVQMERHDFERLAGRIITGLMGYHRDYRPDMRDAMPEGIGGAEFPLRIPL